MTRLKQFEANLVERLRGYDGVIVWGSSSMAKSAINIGLNNILYLVDSFSHGHSVENIPVRSPDELKTEQRRVFILIATYSFREVMTWLEKNGIEYDCGYYYDLIADSASDANELDKLRIDLMAYYETSWYETIVRKPQFLVNISFRLCASLLGKKSVFARSALWFLRLAHAFNCAFFGIHIPSTVKAGPGLQFIHFGGIVLDGAVRMGRFCRLYQSVTLGTDKTGRAPMLGDHVIVWSNAVVIGGCQLGSNCQVGANSVCTGNHSVKNAILAGAPARVLRTVADDSELEKNDGGLQ